MTYRTKALRAWTAAALAVALPACTLTVKNPDDLVEDNIAGLAGIAGIVNGSEALVTESYSAQILRVTMPSDEIFFTGSRDAWLSLDQGFVSNVDNEFSDTSFPAVAQARWMSDFAITSVEDLMADNPGDDGLKGQLAKANLFSAIVYMQVGESQEDFVNSDRRDAAPPVGPMNMFQMLDGAIQRLDRAVQLFGELGDSENVLRATALRARAKHSRAVWDKLNPQASGQNGLVNAGADDARFVVDRTSPSWTFELTYSVSQVENDMAGWINSRKEQQFRKELLNLDADNDPVSVALTDPIDGVADPVLLARVLRFRGQPTLETVGILNTPLDLVTHRMMLLILAEAELAKGNEAGFTTYVNEVRAIDGLTPYAGQIPALDLLLHERRVNLLVMGLRLQDMYRFGIRSPVWEPSSESVQQPGVLLPITSIEIRANCNLNGLGCR